MPGTQARPPPLLRARTRGARPRSPRRRSPPAGLTSGGAAGLQARPRAAGSAGWRRLAGRHRAKGGGGLRRHKATAAATRGVPAAAKLGGGGSGRREHQGVRVALGRAEVAPREEQRGLAACAGGGGAFRGGAASIRRRRRRFGWGIGRGVGGGRNWAHRGSIWGGGWPGKGARR